MEKAAVILLSGGLDSATTLALARRQGFAIHALTFDYGQRHGIEVQRARAIARDLGAATHRVISLDLRSIGGSALTSDGPIPRDRDDPASGGIPATYVPARNTIFLAIGLAQAEAIGSRDIFIGVNALDYSGYPDCRTPFLRAFEDLAALATRAGVEEGVRFRIRAPLVRMTKAEIIRLALDLGVDLAGTHSCYDPDGEGRACARCDSCRLRMKGFREAGVPDPTRYVP
ncbi:MAG: 7-cyano-7-deazaguanine synthase QueC [Planctomycetes bacterium]|nr:7-cyano-7-deazaguanine synthase QueC [Planctomycetota bacterium]